MIKEAVILAARREKDSEIPYPLIPFDEASGHTLMDRTLGILRGLGIERICIVAGYKAELFRRFEAGDVTLVVNEDYRHTASMSSLALAAPLISGDFLLVESDVLCERKVYADLVYTDRRNCLTIVSESGSGDEAFVETDGDIVLKISKDLHQHNHIDGEMIGISKISYDALRKMMLRWESNTNPYMNYEYLFMDATQKHEHQFLMQRDVMWCDVDNASDMKNLKERIWPKLRKKEDPFDRLNIISHLKKIFPQKELDSDLPIDFIGGMTNRNFKVSVDGKSYVLRIPGNGTEGMIERNNEGHNSMLSYKMGISPAIPYINGETGIKLTDFIANAETLSPATIQRYDNIVRIAAIFSRLHNAPVRLNNEFNVFKEILNYERLMRECGARMYEGYEEFRPKVLELEDTLNDIGVRLTPCHNDLVAENFIKDPSGKIYLIDWEYSGMNDPMWDLAALFLESDFSADNEALFLGMYFGEKRVPEWAVKKILIYKILCDTLWSIWTVVKEKQGDDFGDYGSDRFRRAIDNYKKLTDNDF